MYINIAFALNQTIYLSLLTTINSIIKNTRYPEKIQFNIVVPSQEIVFFTNQINQTFPDRLFSVRIQDYTPPEVVKQYLDSKYKEQSADRRMSRNMQFARFFLRDIFGDLSKVIYLDTDLIVLRDITELFNAVESFSASQYFAAVPQRLPPVAHFNYPIRGFKETRGMKQSFNSGVFLTDFSYWTEGTYARLKYCLDLDSQYNYHLYRVGDETILNLMFKDFIPLNKNWNRCGYGNSKLVAFLFQCDVKTANVIHWSGGYHKPWKTPDIIYAELWNRYNPYQKASNPIVLETMT